MAKKAPQRASVAALYGDFINVCFGSALSGRPMACFPEPARNDDPLDAFAFAATVLEVLFE